MINFVRLQISVSGTRLVSLITDALYPAKICLNYYISIFFIIILVSYFIMVRNFEIDVVLQSYVRCDSLTENIINTMFSTSY